MPENSNQYPSLKINQRFLIIVMMFMLSCGIIDDNECPEISFPPENRHQITITQGIWGNVWLWEGNFQPVCPSGKVYAVVREIYIHEATPLDSVDFLPDSPFIINIRTPLIKTVKSISSGFYQAALDTGTYSVFVREDTVFYFGSANNSYLEPGSVAENEIEKVQLDITYNAAY